MIRRPSSSQSGFTLIELMIVIAIVAILASILLPSFVRTRAMTQLTGCKSNLKNIATALEAYSADHGGHYPPALAGITPNYIKTIPPCPAASSDTYSSSYTSSLNPDVYQFFCEGTVHDALSVPADYPRWDSGSGLDER